MPILGTRAHLRMRTNRYVRIIKLTSNKITAFITESGSNDRASHPIKTSCFTLIKCVPTISHQSISNPSGELVAIGCISLEVCAGGENGPFGMAQGRPFDTARCKRFRVRGLNHMHIPLWVWHFKMLSSKGVPNCQS